LNWLEITDEEKQKTFKSYFNGCAIEDGDVINRVKDLTSAHPDE